MRLLLDTHIVLWWAANMRQLRGDIRAAIETAEEVYISAASVWEAELKRSRGTLSFPGSFQDVLDKNGFHALSVTFRHAEAAAALPLHHRDPFDRMLVAQTITERCTLVTTDRHLSRYDVTILDA